MNYKEKLEAVEDGFKKFSGYDFFMVDSRDVEVKAAPFHILNVEHEKLFIEEASQFIPWIASLSPRN